MNATRVAATALFTGASALTVGMGVAGSTEAVTASASVRASPPTGIGWSFEWDDEDDDWQQTATWECPAGCSITWEDNY